MRSRDNELYKLKIVSQLPHLPVKTDSFRKSMAVLYKYINAQTLAAVGILLPVNSFPADYFLSDPVSCFRLARQRAVKLTGKERTMGSRK